jgi:Fur family ferric uptake transcriptional regulator
MAGDDTGNRLRVWSHRTGGSARASVPTRRRTKAHAIRSGPAPTCSYAAGVPPPPSPDRPTLLRRHGLRVTTQRLAVLRALADRPHGTADEIYAAVRSETDRISRQAVYDVLTALTVKGLIRRIEPAGSSVRYEDRVGDNHHHLVCRTCGRIVDVDCRVGAAPCLTASDDAGYEVDEAEVIYWGRCPDCAAAGAADA